MKLTPFVIGVTLLAYTPAVFAANATPISDHYVQPILDRVDQGIANLPGATATFWDNVFTDTVTRVQNTALELVDTELRLIQQQRDLRKVTPCLHQDLLILENKIEELRTLTALAFADKRIYDIRHLQSMTRYLNERYQHLALGARNPQYIDEKYHDYHRFDPVSWCCTPSTNECIEKDRKLCNNTFGIPLRNIAGCAEQGCQEPVQAPVLEAACPFHSDYLPPTMEGYGCDLQALDPNLTYYPSVLDERVALNDFIVERDAFYQNIQFMKQLTIDIYNATGQTPPDLTNFTADLNPQNVVPDPSAPPPLTREHRTRRGCSPTDDPDYNPPNVGDKPRPSWPEGAARMELRGMFYLSPDEFQLIRGLYDQLRLWGTQRDNAWVLSVPSDYPDGSQQQLDAHRMVHARDYISYLLHDYTRGYFQKWNRTQAVLDAKPLLQSNDTQEQITALLKPLRASVKEFSQLASQPDQGMRLFNTKFAFFLRRTCMYRPCNKLLERILKINYTDTCFPYTSGEFADDREHHLTCRTDAGVEETL